MIQILALLLSTQVAPAQAQSFESDPLMNMTSVRCDDESIRIKLGNVVLTVLKESLAKFDGFNPRVSEALRLRLQTRRLVVTCDGHDKLERKGAAADSGPRFLGAYRIRLGLEVGDVTGSTSQKNTILHELLHFAKIDNFPTSVHNNPRAIMAQDNVYSCAEVVYPDWFRYNDAKTKEATETCRKALD